MWVQGLELSDSVIRDILSVSITLREGKAADGSLSLFDVDFKYFDSKVFSKNRELLFVLGFTDDAVPLGPFVIKSITMEAPETGTPVLSVEFQDMTHKLHKKKEKVRYDGSCTDVFKKVAEKANLGYRTNSPKDVKFDEEKALIQANKSKAAMINSLAERYGFVWGVEGKTMYFRRPVSLDELGEQPFIPVLSYRINDFSIMDYTASFKYTREKIKQGAEVVVENIDFENCEETGSFLSRVLAGEVDVPAPLLEALGFEFPADYELDEDTATNKNELTERESELVAEINKVIASGGADANKAIKAMQDVEYDPVGAAADALGIERDTNLAEKVKSIDPTNALSTVDRNMSTSDWTTMFKAGVKGVKDALFGAAELLDNNTENSLKDFSGSATPASSAEAKDKEKAVLYRSVIVCEATITPTIASPRYKPSMGVIACGLGKRLSGKYRITEVLLNYSHSEVFTTRLVTQKRYYGITPKDKKRVAEATKAMEAGDTNQSTPGGPDKSKLGTEATITVNRDANSSTYTVITEKKELGDS